MDSDHGKVLEKMFVLPSGDRMMATCKHSKRSACGGCYQRLDYYIQKATDLLEGGDVQGALEALRDSVRFRKTGE
jgi:hypothetical protein